MSDNSKIEWTDSTWTPIRARNLKTGKTGWYCEHATTGCEFCYAEGMNKRLGTGLPFKPGHRKDVEIFLDEKMLLAPLRWKKPRMIFVCSMTDLFADFVPDEWIDRVFAVMALSPQHTFQVLTKRAARMREYFNGPYNDGNGVYARIAEATWSIAPSRADLPEPPVFIEVPVGPRLPSGLPEFGFRRMMHPKAWPLKNVWLGVSTERQQEADERIPLLLQTPAAVRFISAEPLLGPIDLTQAFAIAPSDIPMLTPEAKLCADPTCGREGRHYPREFGCRWGLEGEGPPQIDWVIAGGESGHGARPIHPDWARSLRDQCDAAGVAYFFKQWGAFAPAKSWNVCRQHAVWLPNGDCLIIKSGWPERNVVPMLYSERLPKHDAGRLLDGVEHNAMPTVRP